MRRFGFAAFLALAVVVGAVGVTAYNLGATAGATDAAIAAGASVIYAPATFSPLGIVIGLFFLVLFLGFMARFVAGPRRSMGWGGWSGPGGPRRWSHHRGDWDHETVPEPFRSMLERWHRDTHMASSTPGPDMRPPKPPAGPGSRPTV